MAKIDPERLKEAAQLKGVALDDDVAVRLVAILAIAEEMHGRRFGHKSLDDIYGPGGRARFEDALPAARASLECAIAVARSPPEIVECIGEIDPVQTIANDALVSTSGMLEDHSFEIAEAARKLNSGIAVAWASLTQQEQQLLREARFKPRPPGRPKTGLGLAQRLTLAAYYVWDQCGRDTQVPRANRRASGVQSELVVTIEIALKLLGIEVEQATIVSTIHKYRAEVLRKPEKGLAHSMGMRPPIRADFLT